jgi:hypothetical protein
MDKMNKKDNEPWQSTFTHKHVKVSSRSIPPLPKRKKERNPINC